VATSHLATVLGDLAPEADAVTVDIAITDVADGHL